jgi:hypothetical protein
MFITQQYLAATNKSGGPLLSLKVKSHIYQDFFCLSSLCYLHLHSSLVAPYNVELFMKTLLSERLEIEFKRSIQYGDVRSPRGDHSVQAAPLGSTTTGAPSSAGTFNTDEID